MKKIKSLILLPLLGSLTLGLVSILNNKKAESVDASSMNRSNGTFVRVDNYGDIDYGMDVIFVSDHGYALDDVWGNPGFVHGSQEGVATFDNGKYITLTNSKATVFHVLKGTETRIYEGEPQKSYAFKADVMSISGERMENVYFAHNEEENYDGRNDYDYIGWFYGNDIAVQQRLIKESSWYLDFSTEEDWDGTKTITHIRNCKNYENYPESELGFTHRYSDRFCSDGTHNVYIYRQFNESEYNIHIKKSPNKTEYQYGESIDLTGLEIVLNSPIYEDELIVYNDSTKNDFVFPETAYGSGTISLQCYYKQFSFAINDITVNKPDLIVTKTGNQADYRGSYMLIDQFYGLGFNTKDATTSLWDCKMTLSQDEYGRPKAKTDTDYSDSKFTVTKDSYGYHMVNADGRYLDLENFKMSDDPTTTVVFDDSGSAGVRVKSPNGSFTYLYMDNEYHFGIGPKDAYYPVVLYSYPTTTEQESSFDTYLEQFFEGTDVCSPDGSIFSIDDTTWDGLEAAFNALDPTVQGMFANITYDISEIKNKDAKFAMSRYDYIYQKYHSTYDYITDFIGRSSVGTMQELYNGSNTVLLNYSNSNSAVLLITITALCSVTSIGVLLIIKKRKAIK